MAYFRVADAFWEFILTILRSLGFPENSRSWIKNCVLAGSSQIIVNGLIGKRINLRQGVRQVDPVSPIRFIIGMDFLSRWFCRLVANGAWQLPFHGMKPCLLYADDALFFIKLDTRHVQMLKIALAVFR